MHQTNNAVGIAVLVFAIALTGCQSGKFSNYISPQVSGRVLAADTHQPIADAKVRRVVPDQNNDASGPPKGGQVMERTPAVWTDAEGRFVLDSERDFGLFNHGGWWSVTILYEREGYELFQTNYTLANVSSNSPEGEPRVNAGDILLRRRAR